MEMLCVFCELVIAVCTLVYLFNLQQTADSSRDLALSFLSLTFTVAVFAMAVIGPDRVSRGAHTVLSRISGTPRSPLAGEALRRPDEVSTSVSVLPIFHDETED